MRGVYEPLIPPALTPALSRGERSKCEFQQTPRARPGEAGVNQTERLYRIEQLLRSRRHVPRDDFLRDLEVSRATFSRDLETLRDRLQRADRLRPGAARLPARRTARRGAAPRIARPVVQQPGGPRAAGLSPLSRKPRTGPARRTHCAAQEAHRGAARTRRAVARG
ncbi:MAG: hypothetical protein MZU91_08385 [Desulfosudis oleivorans]|nr:hypothetical protein [Desulfosudis oleivorans]